MTTSTSRARGRIARGGAVGAALAVLLGFLGLGALPAQAAAVPRVVAAAAATLIAPTSGTPLGGDTVTITGIGFTGATGVTFGGTPAMTFAVVDDTTVTATTPAHAPGAVDVVVQQPTGDSAPLTYTFLAPPTVTDVSYNRVSESGGTVVTVWGTGFTGATGVTFGGTAAPAFTVTSDSMITVTTPAHAPGVVDVVVEHPNGDSQPGSITYVPVTTAVITSLSPDHGPSVGNPTITITGTGFSGALFVLVASAPVPFTVVSDTEITFSLPGLRGQVPVQVQTANGVSGAATFTYDPILVVTGVSPASGPTTGGTLVTLSGECFTGATGVTFGGVPARTFTVVDDTTITAIAPAGSGVVDLQVQPSVACQGLLQTAIFTYVAVTASTSADGPTATLADTGSSTPAGPMLAGGGVFLAAGAALLVARNRRRGLTPVSGPQDGPRQPTV